MLVGGSRRTSYVNRQGALVFRFKIFSNGMFLSRGLFRLLRIELARLWCLCLSQLMTVQVLKHFRPPKTEI